MKTTVEIPDPLLRTLREKAAREGTTLKSLIHTAIAQFLSPRKGPSGKQFRLRDESFQGTGLAPGIEEGNWSQVRSIIYEGRGG